MLERAIIDFYNNIQSADLLFRNDGDGTRIGAVKHVEALHGHI